MNILDKEKITKEEFIRTCNEAESMAKAAALLNLKPTTFKKYAIQFNCYHTNQGGVGIKKKVPSTRYSTEDILSGKYPQYQSGKLKQRLIDEGYKQRYCERCKIKQWMGKPIVLELHHKNGNTHDHRLENLEILCPNCHSQTDNWKFKNKSASRKRTELLRGKKKVKTAK